MANTRTLKFIAALQNTEENENSCEEKVIQSHEKLTLENKSNILNLKSFPLLHLKGIYLYRNLFLNFIDICGYFKVWHTCSDVSESAIKFLSALFFLNKKFKEMSRREWELILKDFDLQVHSTQGLHIQTSK